MRKFLVMCWYRLNLMLGWQCGVALDQRFGRCCGRTAEDGRPHLIDFQISFDLKQEDDFAVILFKHEGWREPVEFMSHCSTKWATFLMSLKAYVETGKGLPSPDDVKISNWH